jgi:hypothetical protein
VAFQLLGSAERVALKGENMNTAKRKREVRLEVNADKTKHMFISHHIM